MLGGGKDGGSSASQKHSLKSQSANDNLWKIKAAPYITRTIFLNMYINLQNQVDKWARPHRKDGEGTWIKKKNLIEKIEKGHETKNIRNLEVPKSHEMMFNIISSRRGTNSPAMKFHFLKYQIGKVITFENRLREDLEELAHWGSCKWKHLMRSCCLY